MLWWEVSTQNLWKYFWNSMYIKVFSIHYLLKQHVTFLQELVANHSPAVPLMLITVTPSPRESWDQGNQNVTPSKLNELEVSRCLELGGTRIFTCQLLQREMWLIYLLTFVNKSYIPLGSSCHFQQIFPLLVLPRDPASQNVIDLGGLRITCSPRDQRFAG